MTEQRLIPILATASAGLLMVGLCGCLNPAFVNQLSGGSVVPLAPGDMPYVHLLCINATTDFAVGFQFGFTPAYRGVNTLYLLDIQPEEQAGAVLPCPVDQVALGNPTDLTVPAMILTPLNGGTTIDVPPSAFPLVLRSGTDFVCGDTLVFAVVNDRNSGYGIQVSTGKVLGAGQTGPFTGPDTFQILYAALLTGGVPPVPIP